MGNENQVRQRELIDKSLTNAIQFVLLHRWEHGTHVQPDNCSVTCVRPLQCALVLSAVAHSREGTTGQTSTLLGCILSVVFLKHTQSIVGVQTRMKTVRTYYGD